MKLLNVLGKLRVGKKLSEGKLGDKVVTLLKDRFNVIVEKKKIGLYFDLAILVILGLGMLFTDKVSFEQFIKGVEIIE
jgi:hypothetical protein